MNKKDLNMTTYIAKDGGYDGKKCLVHARCCAKGQLMIATAQYLDVEGIDIFSGLLMSRSLDGGKTWSKFVPQSGLAPVLEENQYCIGCDATPMYHKKSGKIILIGQSGCRKSDTKAYITGSRRTFYSIYDEENNAFGKMKFIELPIESLPPDYAGSGCGSGQCVELENGNILIPMSYEQAGCDLFSSLSVKCEFNGEDMHVLETGNALTVPFGRGLYEPSLTYHANMYYMTLRNDECAFVAQSIDGINFDNLQLWKWEDDSIVESYNTQQHWLTLGKDLYLVYTRRGVNNDHVFRHRAPLLIARVENLHLIKESEQICVKERGARLGNFGVAAIDDNHAIIMAAEWMQPKGCEKYGSDNSIFVTYVEKN